MGGKNAQAQIVQSPIQFDYTTGMRSHGGHVHPADKLLPFYLTTLQFCFPCFTLQENRQLVNSVTCHLLFPSSPVSRKQTYSKVYIISTS